MLLFSLEMIHFKAATFMYLVVLVFFNSCLLMFRKYNNVISIPHSF